MDFIVATAVLAVVAGIFVLTLKARAERTDPVCGMDVEASTLYTWQYRGRHYRFCTRSCLNKFQTDPEQWLRRSTTQEHG